MKKQKNKGFTLVEIIIAVLIFTVITAGFTTFMVHIYMSSNKVKLYTERMYQNKKELEEISSVIDDAGLKFGQDKIELAKKIDTKFTKEPTKKAEILAFVNDDNNVKYVNEFKLFKSSAYECGVDGFAVKKEQFKSSDTNAKKVGGSSKFVYFIANTNAKKLKKPIVEKTYIAEKTDVNASDEVSYAYLHEKDINNKMLIKYLLKKDTEKYLMSARFNWFVTDTKGDFKGSKTPYEPVLLDNDGVSVTDIEAFYDKAIADNKFPLSHENFFKELSITGRFLGDIKGIKAKGDFYLKTSVKPLALTNVKTHTRFSKPVWMINLPKTDNLLYHYDFSIDGGYIGKGETVEVDEVKDRSKALHRSLSEKTVEDSLQSNLKENGSKIILKKDDYYGKYLALSNKPVVANQTRQVDLGNNEITAFVVVDIPNITFPSRPMMIMDKRLKSIPSKSSYTLSYNPFRKMLYFYCGHDGNATRLINPFSANIKTKPGKQIVIVKARDYDQNNRREYIGVNDHTKMQYHNVGKQYSDWMVDRYMPLVIGGQNNPKPNVADKNKIKVYEILAYSKLLTDDTEQTNILNYLKYKHNIK